MSSEEVKWLFAKKKEFKFMNLKLMNLGINNVQQQIYCFTYKVKFMLQIKNHLQ